MRDVEGVDVVMKQIWKTHHAKLEKKLATMELWLTSTAEFLFGQNQLLASTKKSEKWRNLICWLPPGCRKLILP